MSTQETTLPVRPGTSITYAGEFRDVDGVLTDPTKVGFALRSPHGQETYFVYGTDSEVTRVSEGIYRFTVLPTSGPGEYEVELAGSGAIAVTAGRKFRVGETRFTENWLATA